MLKNYEQHNEVKSFFTDILYKLWQNGILSTADIYAHGGPWRCVKFHSHHIFSKCGKHSSTLKRLTSLASKKSFLGKNKMSENEMSEDEKQSWKTIFDSLCKENTYELDKDDIRSVFTIINSNRKANGQKEIAMSDEEFETIFADVDADDSGQIDFDEFVAFVQMAGKGKISGLSADFDVTIGALEAARYKPIFDRVDEDCDGELSKDEVKRLFHLIHDEKKADSETVWEFTNEQVDRLFDATDIDNSGSVDFEEFVILLQRLEKGEMKHIVPQFQKYKRLSLHGDGRELNMLRSIFNEVDDDESGELDRDEAKIFFEKVNMDRKKRGKCFNLN